VAGGRSGRDTGSREAAKFRREKDRSCHILLISASAGDAWALAPPGPVVPLSQVAGDTVDLIKANGIDRAAVS
jgi:hypothetical protein